MTRTVLGIDGVEGSIICPTSRSPLGEIRAPGVNHPTRSSLPRSMDADRFPRATPRPSLCLRHQLPLNIDALKRCASRLVSVSAAARCARIAAGKFVLVDQFIDAPSRAKNFFGSARRTRLGRRSGPPVLPMRTKGVEQSRSTNSARHLPRHGGTSSRRGPSPISRSWGLMDRHDQHAEAKLP